MKKKYARRPGLPAGQIQDAFDTSRPIEGVHAFAACLACVYKVRTREFMITTIVLPEPVASVDLGDPASFTVRIRPPRMVAVRPNAAGTDTSITVHGAEGGLYPFYVRAESFNSRNVSDLVVRIADPALALLEPAAAGGPAALGRDDGREGAGASSAASDDSGKAAGRAGPAPADTAALAAAGERRPGDFVERVEFDPATLHGWGDYELRGDEALAPEVVFCDACFTYLQYGERWAGLDLPAAYVVVDGFDELVNTRVAGRTYIIESTAALIALKSGKRYLCIEYRGGPPPAAAGAP